MLQEVPEEIIQKAAKYMQDPTSNFIYALEMGKKFKDAGMKPIYLYNLMDNIILVTTEERIENKLN